MRIIACLIAMVACCSAFATTKGLNQIITPDIQPEGQLSISYQQQDPKIGNPSEIQLELGLNRYSEVALFRGLDPNQWVLGCETGVQRGSNLFAAGFANWTTGSGTHANPQPFVEYGYYEGKHKAIAGAIRASNHTEAILGYAYQWTPRMQLQADWQSGSGNSSTLGFTYNIAPNLSFNPSVYLPNDAPRTMHGYAVLTWTVELWK